MAYFGRTIIGGFVPKFRDKNWWSGVAFCNFLFIFAWGHLVLTGNVSSTWPLFGISNQLLAACALIVCTTMLISLNRGKYALCSAIPGIFMALIIFWAGYIQVVDIYFPAEQYLLAGMAIAAMFLTLIVFIGAFRKWSELLKSKASDIDYYAETVKEQIER